MWYLPPNIVGTSEPAFQVAKTRSFTTLDKDDICPKCGDKFQSAFPECWKCTHYKATFNFKAGDTLWDGLA